MKARGSLLTGVETLGATALPRVREAVAPRLAQARNVLGPTVARAREAAAPWAARAQARVAPARAWIVGEIAKSATLTKALDAVAGTWATLVESFCATIDPYLSRWFPDLRLVAMVMPSGALALTRMLKSDATFLGAPEALGEEGRAGLSAARWTAIELRLPPDQVLQRTLSLPAASREFLASIIAHKLERLTPWRPERVLYGYRISEESEGGTLAVELFATSKDVVAAPLQALGALGLSPTAIGLDDGPASVPLAINLLRDAPKAARVDSRRLVGRVALASFALTGVLWLASSMWASSADDAAQIAGTRLLKARRLLKIATMGDVGERERALIEAKTTERSIVVLVDKLASAIPADTYLKELSIAPDKVRLVGITTNAPALVGEIEATGLRNVRFSSAVTREKDAKDSFEITADRAAPPPAEAP